MITQSSSCIIDRYVHHHQRYHLCNFNDTTSIQLHRYVHQCQHHDTYRWLLSSIDTIIAIDDCYHRSIRSLQSMIVIIDRDECYLRLLSLSSTSSIVTFVIFDQLELHLRSRWIRLYSSSSIDDDERTSARNHEVAGRGITDRWSRDLARVYISAGI